MQQEWKDAEAAGEQRTEETMQQEAEALIKSQDGDTSYAEACFITSAVGFRSGDLPEPFKGDAEAAIAAYHARPLIRQTGGWGGDLNVKVDEALFASMQIEE